MNKQSKPLVNLEVCANSVASALAAQEGGAFRVELCENLSEGGTTPSYGQIELARKLLNIKLYVLIRPRGGDFLYSDTEFEIMKADITHCIKTGCDGVVIGILNADGTVDKQRSGELAQMAKNAGLGVTFHRAIDMCADMEQALEDAISIGCERILTSGGRSTAIEGVNVIAHLVEKAKDRVSIMPGAGVNETTVADIVQFTHATEVHSSARKDVKSKMTYRNDHILMGYGETDEYSFSQTDAERVKEIIRLANE
ncbi:MAG TPA: copper homeostasis protein CutC [Mucilaginibacter sp.]|jgi:copper homeostasis protein|nr:copper homeostasis protein CutC [Mucilaginibacter sp.]